MFIAQTARNFGLTVNDQTDERIDVKKETDAAMRMLAGLNLQFEDWGLALYGYNNGPKAVEKAIANSGSRDVWQILHTHPENDPNYIASVFAAVLILKNPGVLN